MPRTLKDVVVERVAALRAELKACAADSEAQLRIPDFIEELMTDKQMMFTSHVARIMAPAETYLNDWHRIAEATPEDAELPEETFQVLSQTALEVTLRADPTASEQVQRYFDMLDELFSDDSIALDRRSDIFLFGHFALWVERKLAAIPS